jgi:hypothetical protein
MQSIYEGRAPVTLLARALTEHAHSVFSPKLGHLREAIAGALGYTSYASFCNGATSTGVPRPTMFDLASFATRLGDLVDNPATAWALAELASGVDLDIQIDEHPPGRQTAGIRQYGVSVELTGLTESAIARGLRFELPRFMRHGVESYRVDSAWRFRSDDDDASVVTRYRTGRGLMTCRLIDGRWEGELFIYAARYQVDDRPCLTAVKAALARAILPAVSNGVRCRIYQPDAYVRGAWRVEVELPSAALNVLGGSGLSFPVRDLPARRLHGDDGFRYASPSGGQFVDGLWRAHLYTNGVSEEDNRTSLSRVAHGILAAVYESLAKAGYHYAARDAVLGIPFDALVDGPDRAA